MLPVNYEEARKNGDVCVIGCDPGPVSSAIITVLLPCKNRPADKPILLNALYSTNVDLRSGFGLLNIYRLMLSEPNELLTDQLRRRAAWWPVFLAYECCGAQGRFVGESVFETAAMGGEIRREFRPVVSGTYKLKPGEWRHALCGRANAKTPEIYAAFSEFFDQTGGGHDPLKGNKTQPGPLAALHEAGKGGNVEHLKDALGVALSLDRIRYRSGKDPETYRMPM